MATYAIGDIQGCYDEFRRLLDLLKFNPSKDKLWIVGDLVNRGPASLAVIKYIMSLKDAAVVVLGNHELHLLALSQNPQLKQGKNDTLRQILDSPELDQFTRWLCAKPLFHYDNKLKFAMVHAGLPPEWSAKDALIHSNELSRILSDEVEGKNFLNNMYGNEPSIWNDSLEGIERWKFIADCLTRCRYFTSNGYLEFEEKRHPSVAKDGLRPWYLMPNARWRGTPIVFGHWASLSVPKRTILENQIFPIDTGAVWGRDLTAMRLEDREIFSVPAKIT
jgi:bis(5'-nucleosyl)-tetraphosphatase (symmetrical)